ncbi:MAG: type II toxin-antitoxin system PemK/MazF family toxin [Candidatus Moeniiplasma glomeromycotorum]|nr:type II toxin-antitoxin system PemK/MazF family toxin [Candidatus Moeniiplasma glomeromycotorum]
MKISRGDIFWVDFRKLKEIEASSGSEINGKKRPAVVVSEEWQNEKGRRVIILPMSTKVKNIYRFDLYVGKVIRGYEESKVVCEQVRSIDKRKLREKAGRLSKEWMVKIDEKLRKILAL